MVDVSSGDKKINITVSTSGNKASVNATPDMAMYYSNKSREWAISDKIVDNEDYSSKYYANISKEQAQIAVDSRIQSDWEQQDVLLLDYIKNKPNLNIYATNEELNKNTDSHSVTRIYDSGISTDCEGYEKVYNLKYSQFDRSKVTVVGTPLITEDGVGSGFSGSNYLRIATSKTFVNTINKWEVHFLHTIKSGANNGMFTLDGLGFAYQGNDKTIFFVCEWEGGALSIGGDRLLDNTTYEFIWGMDSPDNMYVKYREVNSNTWFEQTSTYTATSKTFDGNVVIGIASGLSALGEIDLKQFSITVDGEEVYNCLKTGIDTVKPDDYGVAGNPVITDDGIASGFSGFNYLTSGTNTFDLANSMSYEIKTRAKFSSNPPDNSMLWGFGSTLYLYQNSGGSVVFTDVTSGVVLSFNPEENTVYDIICGHNANNLFYIKYKTTTDTEYTLVSATVTTRTNVNQTISIGTYMTGGYPFIGAYIDLNAVEVYVNDSLVWQPCLKIPYTEAKTGAKIVDAQYRNRVQEWYEQSGEGNYYTIDEENKNFSLPLPDLYGLIEKNAEKINRLQMDWSEWAGNLQNKANRSEVDGTWVSLFQNLSNATAIGNYTVDMNQYLPDDNHFYEICIRAHIDRGNDNSGANTVLRITTPFYDDNRIMVLEADGQNFQQANGTCNLVVDSSRTVTLSIEGYVARSLYIDMQAYRQLGLRG